MMKYSFVLYIFFLIVLLILVCEMVFGVDAVDQLPAQRGGVSGFAQGGLGLGDPRREGGTLSPAILSIYPK